MWPVQGGCGPAHPPAMSALTAIWGEAMLDGIGCPVTPTRNASAKPIGVSRTSPCGKIWGIEKPGQPFRVLNARQRGTPPERNEATNGILQQDRSASPARSGNAKQ